MAKRTTNLVKAMRLLRTAAWDYRQDASMYASNGDDVRGRSLNAKANEIDVVLAGVALEAREFAAEVHHG